MPRLTLLANSGTGQPSAKDMLKSDGTCRCPTYVLGKEAAAAIRRAIKSNTEVSLVLLDRLTRERYEGQISNIKQQNQQSKDALSITRFNIYGCGMHPAAFKDDTGLSYAGVGWIP